MQRALVRFNDGTYTEVIALGQHEYDFAQYELTTDLLNNTEYPPELIQTLNNNYAHWVLIISEEGAETDALLVAYNADAYILALGDFINIVDWVRDATNWGPFNPAPATCWCATLAYLFDVSSLLDYLYDLNCLVGCEKLCLVQADNGVEYWGCFLPTTYLQ